MAETTEKILLQLELDVALTLQNLEKAKTAFASLKNEGKDLNDKLKDLKDSGVNSGATFDNLNRLIIANAAATKVTQQEINNYNKQLQISIQSANAADGSYEKLLRQYQLASIELKNQEGLLQQNADGTFQLTEAYTNAAAGVTKAKEAIIAFDQGIKDGRSNVGNYKTAIDSAFKDFKNSTDKVAQLKFEIQELKNAFKSGTTDQQEFNKQLAELTVQLQGGTAETEKLGQKLDDLKALTNSNAEGFLSLREQLRLAKDEATRAQDQFQKGLIDENQLEASQQKVANLTEELSDFNKRIEALNPEAKFKAFAQGAASIAGGLTAAQGAMSLFGVESEETGKALLKVQSLLAVTQGLNQLAELGDAFKNIQIVLGLTTAAKKADTIAQVENTAATEAGVVATGELAVAEEGAAASTGILTTAMEGLTSPIGLVIIGITAALALFAAFSADAAPSVEEVTLSVNRQKAAIDEEVKSLKAKGAEELSQAEIAVQIAKTRGTSGKELFDLEDKILEVRKKNIDIDAEGLRKQIENSKTLLKVKADELKELELQQKRATRTDVSGVVSVDVIVAPSKEKFEKAKDEVKKQQSEISQLQREFDVKTKTETDKIAAEKILSDIKRAEEEKRIQEQAETVRISLIKNEREKEIKTEIESNNEKLRQLKKSEVDSSKLIEAETAASANRIKEINLKFDLQELQERTQIEINSTVEGTEARLSVERSNALRIRDEKLKDDHLTATQRILIESETQNTISEIESKRVQVVQNRIQKEIELEQRKKDAEIAIARASVREGDVENNFSVRLSEINNELIKEEAVLEQSRNRETIANDLHTSEELEKLKFSSEFKTLTVQQQSEKILSIIKEGEDKENAIIDASDAEKIAKAKQTAQSLIAASGERFNDIAEIHRIELETKKAELESELALEIEGSKRFLELQKELEKNKSDLAKNAGEGRLAQLIDLQAQGLKLNDKELAEYNKLIAQRKLADAEYSKSRIENNDQANQILQQATVDFYFGLLQIALDSSHQRAQAELDAIQTVLDAQLKALDVQQAKEEGTFVERTAIEKKFDAERQKLKDDAAEKEKKIKHDEAVKEKEVAVFESIINTAVAVVKALPNIPLSIAVGVAGAAQTALIAAKPIPEFYFGGYSSAGGHTGFGDPKAVSTTLGQKPYVYHAQEYIAPAKVIDTPRGRQLVAELEAIRQNIHLGYAKEFHSGGFSEGKPLTQVQQSLISVDKIHSNLSENIRNILTLSDEKINVLEKEKQTELSLLRKSSDEKTKLTEEFKNKEQSIISRKEIEITKTKELASEVQLSHVVKAHDHILLVNQKATETFLKDKTSVQKDSSEARFVKTISDSNRVFKTFYDGGYTGKGNPLSVSTVAGPKPYQYHYEEYIVPSFVLSTPAGAHMATQLESIRQRMTGVSSSSSFASGGLADVLVNSQSINQPQVNVPNQLTPEIVATIADAAAGKAAEIVMAKFPPIIVPAENMTEVQAQQSQIKARANI